MPARSLLSWLAARSRHIMARRAESVALRASLGLKPGERILAAARHPAGHPVLAASDRALYYRAEQDREAGQRRDSASRPGAEGPWSRLGWEQVTRTRWDTDGLRLTVSGLTGGVRTRAVVALRSRGSMPEIVRERIVHTRLGRGHVALPDGRHLLIEARRRPVTGELSWLVVSGGPRPGLGDASVRAHVTRAVARMSEDFGIPHQPAPGPERAWPKG